MIAENRELAERTPLLAIPSQIALLRRETERQIRDMLAYEDRVDVVLGAGLAFGARSLADQRKAPYAFVCYTLAGIRDDAYPPAAAPVFGLPKAGNRALWWTITRSFDLALKGPFDRARRAHGLGPEPAPWRRIHAARTLLAQDALVGALSPDAARFCHQVPALVPPARESAALPPAVEAFLKGSTTGANGSTRKLPVAYVGFGSMPSADRERVVRAVIDFHRATGTRVLLYSARAEERGVALPNGVLSVGTLDHATLFPRLDWIVHHGGAGTLATALRSGVPQLIVPHIVDQFFHGRRVEELGLGPAPIPKARLDAKSLIDAWNVTDGFRDRARAVAASLAGTSGAEAAADYVENLLAS